MKKLGIALLFVGLTLFCWQMAYGLNTPTGFVMTALSPTTTAITVTFTALDSLNKANDDSVTIRNAADSTWVATMVNDTATTRSITGLIPNHTYIWVVSVDSAGVYKVSTPDTLATTALVFAITPGTNPLTTLNWTLTSFDTTGVAADSICVVIADSSIKKYISTTRNPTTGSMTGLSPRTAYTWYIAARHHAVDTHILSNSVTDTTAWISQEPRGRLMNLMTFVDEPMRSATSYNSYRVVSPTTTPVDTITITLRGASDIESTLVYVPWKYTSVTAITTATDSIFYSIWPYIGRTDSLGGWHVQRDNTDSVAVTTATRNLALTALTTTPAQGFYIVLKSWTGTKKVLPVQLFLNRDRY